VAVAVEQLPPEETVQAAEVPPEEVVGDVNSPRTEASVESAVEAPKKKSFVRRLRKSILGY
jgi:hypothetical protein